MSDILPRSRGVVWILGFELIVFHWEKPVPIRQIDLVPAGPAAGLLIDSNLTDPDLDLQWPVSYRFIIYPTLTSKRIQGDL